MHHCKASEKTRITATWSVESDRDCVDAQYRLRTSELQAVRQLLLPRTVSHACQGNAVKASWLDTNSGQTEELQCKGQ